MRSESDSEGRRSGFQRNRELEHLLDRVNGSLWCAEKELLSSSDFAANSHALVFVMGPLRSGTTLLMQLLANTGAVAYPTNMLSRFYGVPLIGAHIQLLLSDPRYRFRDEIDEFSSKVAFNSQNGKTQGALSPNEFWYFWRRFLPFDRLDWLPDDELRRVVDKQLLASELNGLTRVFGKPFAMKGMILNYNIGFLSEVFDNAIFVQLRREPVANVASILDARYRQTGSEEAWYSFKIREYDRLKALAAIPQSAGQLHYINQAIEKGMHALPDARKITIDYEDLCDGPQDVIGTVMNKLGIEKWAYRGPSTFEVKREVTGQQRMEIETALEEFENGAA